MADPRSHDMEHELNQFWNSFASNPDTTVWTGPNAELADALRQIYALDAAPLPASSRERVRSGYKPTNPSKHSLGEAPMNTINSLTLPGSNGYGTVIPVRTAQKRAVRPLHPMLRWLAAAILLVVAVAGFEAIRPGNPEPGNHAGGPSIIAPATPSPVADSSLFRLTIQPDVFPTGGGIGSGMSYFQVPAGTVSDWQPACCTNGVLTYFVISGDLHFSTGAEVRVLRAGSSDEETMAGSDVSLSVGDTLVTKYEIPFTASNTGTEQVELLEWTLVGGGTPFDDVHPDWTYVSGDGWGTMLLPDSPGTLELKTIVLKDSERFDPPAHGIRFVVSTNPDALVSVSSTDGSVLIFGSAYHKEYAVYHISFIPESGEIVQE